MEQPIRRVLPRWPAFAVLLSAAAVLALRWDALPPRWIIHWGPNGQPNGWATKTILGVFGLPAFAAGILVFSEIVGTGRRRAGGTPGSNEPMASAALDFARFSMLGAALMTAFLAIDLPLGPRMPLAALLALSLAPLVVCMGVGGIRLSAVLREVRARGGGAKVEGYHALYYASANDRRLWVPKRSGMGWTINFAHPLGWLVFLLLLGIPFAVVVASSMGR